MFLTVYKIILIFFLFQALGSKVQISIYAPTEDGSLFDYCLLVIWSLAVLTVSIGAYWSGLVRHEL